MITNKYKITIEKDTNDSPVEKLEMILGWELSIDEVLNEVIRPILRFLSFSNKQVDEAFGMDEYGEDLKDD